jgi:hypothetical protein
MPTGQVYQYMKDTLNVDYKGAIAELDRLKALARLKRQSKKRIKPDYIKYYSRHRILPSKLGRTKALFYHPLRSPMNEHGEPEAFHFPSSRSRWERLKLSKQMRAQRKPEKTPWRRKYKGTRHDKKSLAYAVAEVSGWEY